MHLGTKPVWTERALSRPAPFRSGVEGRLPSSWLAALAAGLVAGTLLPSGPAAIVTLAVIIVLGVPHGALDAEVARPALRSRFGQMWFLVFAVPYLGLSALVLAAWVLAPLLTLAAFLAVSAFHFGEEDAGPGLSLEMLLRGGLPIAVPVLLQPAATATLLGTVALRPMAGPPAWLLDLSLGWAGIAVVGCAVLLARRRWAVLAEVAVLFVAFAALSPLTAFAFYFIGFHAPRHMAGLVADPVRAPRVGTVRAAAVHAVPVTLLTILLGAALWPLYPGSGPDRLLALTLQGLAALTLPHLLLHRLPLRAG